MKKTPIKIKQKINIIHCDFSQEWVIKVQNQHELFIYVMVEFFQLDFRECPKDNMHFGMRFKKKIHNIEIIFIMSILFFIKGKFG